MGARAGVIYSIVFDLLIVSFYAFAFHMSKFANPYKYNLDSSYRACSECYMVPSSTPVLVLSLVIACLPWFFGQPSPSEPTPVPTPSNCSAFEPKRPLLVSWVERDNLEAESLAIATLVLLCIVCCCCKCCNQTETEVDKRFTGRTIYVQ